MNNFIKKRTLGRGMVGTTYLVIIKKKYYALKIEHVHKKHIKKSLSSPIWREIEFARNMSKKYPDHFMKLYDYDIVDSCKHIQKYAYNPKIFSKKLQKEIKLLAKSPYCSRKIYSLIDHTFKDKLHKLNRKQLYSAIIQITYVTHLMHKHGYTHNDLHPANIGIKKTKRKYIKIFSKKVPTYGYIYSAIDYDVVLHKKYKLNRDERKKVKDQYAKYYDTSVVLYTMFENPLFNYMQINDIKMGSFTQNFKKFKKHDVYNTIKKYSKNVHIQFILCQIMFPKIYQKIILKGHDPHKTFKIKYRIPKEDVIYIATHINDYKSIVDYFSLRLKS
jgi:serine/threonine protein kinase